MVWYYKLKKITRERRLEKYFLSKWVYILNPLGKVSTKFHKLQII